MAYSLNKVQLLGNLGRDPELRYTQGGDAVVNLAIATTQKWKDKKTGEQQEHTEWHRVAFFGKVAEVIADHCKKGDKLYIEGENRTRPYDKDGETRYVTEVKGRDFIFAGGGQERGQASPGARQLRPAQQGQPAPAPAPEFDDDIPF